eukprot:4644705-Pleurochrysis_carterae.AAC.3
MPTSSQTRQLGVGVAATCVASSFSVGSRMRYAGIKSHSTATSLMRARRWICTRAGAIGASILDACLQSTRPVSSAQCNRGGGGGGFGRQLRMALMGLHSRRIALLEANDPERNNLGQRSSCRRLRWSSISKMNAT